MQQDRHVGKAETEMTKPANSEQSLVGESANVKCISLLSSSHCLPRFPVMVPPLAD